MTRSVSVRPRKWQAPRLRADADARDAAAAILQAALLQAGANAQAAVDLPDPEYLHQLRVGLRRYRSALRLFREFLHKRPRKRLARAARKAMRPLGEARDWDVCVEWLRGAKAAPALLRRANQRREATRESLELPDLGALEVDVTGWKGKSKSLHSFRAQALSDARRRVAKRLRGVDWDDPAKRHRLRIAVKRLRYATDFLGGETRALEALQDTLGELNDLAVARRLLADLNPPASLLRKLAAKERRLLAAARRQVAPLEAED
jgi:triphosphatase